MADSRNVNSGEAVSPSATPAPAVGASRKKKTRKPAPASWMHRMLRGAPGLAVSFMIHVVILLGLTFVILPATACDFVVATLMKLNDLEEIPEPIETSPIALPEKLETTQVVSSLQVAAVSVDTPVDIPQPDLPLELGGTDCEGPAEQKPGDFTLRLDPEERKRQGKKLGLSEESEAAVETGLKWLARMQKSDGSWSFKVPGGDPDVPFADSNSAATSMALLAFLGGGHTHKKGQGNYQDAVQKGLDYLISQPSSSGVAGDLRGKSVSHEGMYTQGLATLAVCEAYALTKDKKLERAAKAATNFIVLAQDSKGGGWRYNPGQEGDTSVTGWQIMALKSAQLGDVKVPSATIGKATFYFNSVQKEGGSQYAYVVKENPNPSPSMTAVALLCRMYLGWTPKTPALKRGVEFLGKVGPSKDDMYYNYYATQVLHHWGDEPWEKWNAVMRDRLVTTQIKEGAHAGSWKPSGAWAGSGGRLMETCLSVMTLEVYYRHLPLYQREKLNADF